MLLLVTLLIISVLVCFWSWQNYLTNERQRQQIKAGNLTQLAMIADLSAEVDQRKKVEQELRDAKEAAERASLSKTQFLANMSHELRTPLNAIIGFADVMAKELLGPLGTPAYKQYADNIAVGGKQLFEILSSILDMARIEAGKAGVSESEFAVNDAINFAIDICKIEPNCANLTIKRPAPEPCVIVCADERLIRQVLVNLISNAVKYSRKNGYVVITIEPLSTGGLDLVVTDNGMGIPQDKFALIMEPFGQIEDVFARAKGGLGLGLPLVKSLARLHGGEFSIQSLADIGTVARFHLPAHRVLAYRQAIVASDQRAIA